MKTPQILETDLQRGEELLWLEEAGAVQYFIKKTGVIALIILVGFVIFAVLSERQADSSNPLWLFLLCLPILAVLSGVVQACRTWYAITSKRLIIFQPGLFESAIESYYPPDIDFIKKLKRRNGAGSIVFSAVRESRGKRTQTVEIGFFGIDDVDAVEALILKLRNYSK